MRTADAAIEGADALDPGRRTAVLIVTGEDSAPDRAVQEILRRFGEFFGRIVFVTVGLIDHGTLDDAGFSSEDPGLAARRKVAEALCAGHRRVREAGMEFLSCVAVGTDPAREVARICSEFAAQSSRIMFFLGKTVFQEPRWYHRLLHDQTAEDIQRRLERRGLPLAILPVVLPG